VATVAPAVVESGDNAYAYIDAMNAAKVALKRAPIDWAVFGAKVGGDICPVIGTALGFVVGWAAGIIITLASGTHAARANSELWKKVKDELGSKGAPTDNETVTWAYYLTMLYLSTGRIWRKNDGALAVELPWPKSNKDPVALMVEDELRDPVDRYADKHPDYRGDPWYWEAERTVQGGLMGMVGGNMGEENRPRETIHSGGATQPKPVAGQTKPWKPVRWHAKPGLYALVPSKRTTWNRGEEARGAYMSHEFRVEPIRDATEWVGPCTPIRDFGDPFTRIATWLKGRMGAMGNG